MGAVCAGGTQRNRSEVHEERSSVGSKKLKSMKSFLKEDKNVESAEYLLDEGTTGSTRGFHSNLHDSGEFPLSISRELKPSTPARSRTGSKAPHVGSFIGKASSVGLDMAVEVLDTLGSSMTNLNTIGFISRAGSRGSRISILAFEVANTITKGANLLHSLSEESVQYLKQEILHSKGVQELVSTDSNELLAIAAADKWEEFEVFSREIVRFGNLCKDPQWHNLDRFFSKLDSEPLSDASQNKLREEVNTTMQELCTLAQHTSELYHELHAMDRFEQDYRRKIEELESLSLPKKGETVMMLHSDVKHQSKIVRGLKKKSLWSKHLEEVVGKLVDIVTFIHQEILEAFENNVLKHAGKEQPPVKPERLGAAGLALHYANLITQIDNIASRPTSLPPNTRDTLYNGLPPVVKTELRSRLQALDTKDEELTVQQIKAEMEKTLHWLVPLALDTSKAHQGFGWVGEWASGSEFGRKTTIQNNLVRLQTLYHADKNKMDAFILEVVTWLHRLIGLVRYKGPRIPPGRSVACRGPPCPSSSHAAEISNNEHQKKNNGQLSVEDKALLEEAMVKRRNVVSGMSKSQEFGICNKGRRIWALSRSTGSSPRAVPERPTANLLDILDGLGSKF